LAAGRFLDLLVEILIDHVSRHEAFIAGFERRDCFIGGGDLAFVRAAGANRRLMIENGWTPRGKVLCVLLTCGVANQDGMWSPFPVCESFDPGVSERRHSCLIDFSPSILTS
jgi:hypothetical protein